MIHVLMLNFKIKRKKFWVGCFILAKEHPSIKYFFVVVVQLLSEAKLLSRI